MTKPPVIGATLEDQINFGESIDLIITYKNGEVPIDLTGATVSIFAAAPPVIKTQAAVTISNASLGKIRFFLGRDDALALRRGRNNWFRLQVVFGAESDDVTPEIYIQVT